MLAIQAIDMSMLCLRTFAVAATVAHSLAPSNNQLQGLRAAIVGGGTFATHMAQYEIFSIELSKNYDTVAWREDLKKVLRLAGEKVLPTVFLFADTQVKDEAMVEDINNILNAG